MYSTNDKNRELAGPVFSLLMIVLIVLSGYFVDPSALADTNSEQYQPTITCFDCP